MAPPEDEQSSHATVTAGAGLLRQAEGGVCSHREHSVRVVLIQ